MLREMLVEHATNHTASVFTTYKNQDLWGGGVEISRQNSRLGCDSGLAWTEGRVMTLKEVKGTGYG